MRSVYKWSWRLFIAGAFMLAYSQSNSMEDHTNNGKSIQASAGTLQWAWKHVWTLVTGEELIPGAEDRNKHDNHIVARMNDGFVN